MTTFSEKLKTEASEIKPWSEWNIVMIDPVSKIRFYLQLPPEIKNQALPKGVALTEENLKTTWPILKNPPSDVIFITRKYYAPLLKNMLSQYDMVETDPTWVEHVLKKENPNATVAFVPKKG